MVVVVAGLAAAAAALVLFQLLEIAQLMSNNIREGGTFHRPVAAAVYRRILQFCEGYKHVDYSETRSPDCDRAPV